MWGHKTVPVVLLFVALQGLILVFLYHNPETFRADSGQQWQGSQEYSNGPVSSIEDSSGSALNSGTSKSEYMKDDLELAPTPTEKPQLPTTEPDTAPEDSIPTDEQSGQAIPSPDTPFVLDDTPQYADPLNDELYLEGFPEKPLTIEDAKLCDEKRTIMLKGSWNCPEDPTCRKCRVQTIERFDDLVQAFRSPGLHKARMQKVKSRFNSTIMIMAVNYGQVYLFLNWACSLTQIGLDPKQLAMVVPTDERAAKVLEGFGFFTVDSSWISKLRNPISGSYKGGANTGGHAAINNIVLLAANELVQANYHICVHDVDIAWLQDVRPFLSLASRRRDLLGMIAPYWEAKGGLNSGFIYVRPSVKSKLFMQSLENLAPLKKTSDQILWNTVLRHLHLLQMNYRILPQEVFYKYSGHNRPKPNKKTLLYHAVGNSKRFHMKFHGVWFFDETCEYYDKQVDEDSNVVVERTSF